MLWRHVLLFCACGASLICNVSAVGAGVHHAGVHHGYHKKASAGTPEMLQFKYAAHRKSKLLEKMLNRHHAMSEILQQQEIIFQNSLALSDNERDNALEGLRVQKNQLDQAVGLVESVLKILVLNLENITYLDFTHLKEISVVTHKVLLSAAVDAEDLSTRLEGLDSQRSSLLSAKRKVNSTGSHVEDMVEHIMKDIADSVDRLQEQIHGHETQTYESEKRVHGAQLETVVRLNDVSHDNGNSSEHKAAVVTTLIDSKNNQYILRRPKDTTLHYEDLSLMNDVILMLALSFVGASIFSAAGMPAFFGYVCTGILLSPTGFNKLENIVQVETLSQFGVFFIIFVLGLEFSLPKLLAVWDISVIGGGILMACILCGTLLVGMVNSIPMSDAVLVGFCISLSSTAIMLKCLDPKEAGTKYGSAIIGILISQDVALAMMIALLPLLHASSATMLWALGKLLISFAIVGLGACLVAMKLLGPVLKLCQHSKELYLLAAVCVMMCTMKVTELLGLSMELGCFMAGLMISANSETAEHTIHVVEPIRDFFACIFFVTIGLHIYPSFLLSQVSGLLTLTTLVVGTKYMLGVSMFCFYYKFDLASASLTAVGLSQISEFSFVLASHGRALGIVGREVYFMLLGTTALSLVSTPVLWKLSKRLLPPPVDHVCSDEDTIQLNRHPDRGMS